MAISFLFSSLEWLIVDESDKLFEEGMRGFRDQVSHLGCHEYGWSQAGVRYQFQCQGNHAYSTFHQLLMCNVFRIQLNQYQMPLRNILKNSLL